MTFQHVTTFLRFCAMVTYIVMAAAFGGVFIPLACLCVGLTAVNIWIWLRER